MEIVVVAAILLIGVVVAVLWSDKVKNEKATTIEPVITPTDPEIEDPRDLR